EWKKMKFMERRIGEDFDGLIISVTKFGFFVELTDLFVEGLVPLNTLTDGDKYKNDRYTYHEDTRQIIGQRSRKTYSLGDRVRGILSHRLPCSSEFLDEIDAGAPLVLIGAPRRIQLLRNIGRERQSIDQRMSHSHQSHGIVDLCKVAAVIASLADQQQHALPPFWPSAEHFRRVGHSVENGCSLVPRLQVLQIRFDDIGLICEILHQIERAVEEKQSCFILTPAQYGIEHSRQASHSAKLPLGATP